MNADLNRRTFLKQSGGLLAAGSAIQLLLAACGNVANGTSSSSSKIDNAGLIKAGTLQWGGDYVSGAPYIFQDPADPSKLVGFEVEIAVAMAKLMGINQKLIETCYGELDQALASNNFDMVMNGWEKTTEREKTQLFSDPYYAYGQQIVVRADDTRFAHFDQNSTVDLTLLHGMTVGTGDGYKAADILSQDSAITTKLYDGDEPFDDVQQKKIDAAMVDVPIVAYYVSGAGPGATPNTALKLLGKPLYPDNYYVGFNKNNKNAPTLLKEINEAIAQLKKDGTLKSIYQKWALWNDQQAKIGIS